MLVKTKPTLLRECNTERLRGLQIISFPQYQSWYYFPKLQAIQKRIVTAARIVRIGKLFM